jgi:hypothetical protein
MQGPYMSISMDRKAYRWLTAFLKEQERKKAEIAYLIMATLQHDRIAFYQDSGGL